MRSTLQSLKEYQDVLLRIADLERMLSMVPPEIQELETEWTSIKDRISDLEKRRGEQEEQLKEKRKSLQESEAKSKKFEEDLHQVTNTREYHAALKEIDGAKKQVHATKENITTRSNELDEIKANLEECTQLEGESRKRYESEMESLKVSQKDQAAELSEKSLVRDKLAENIPPKVMSQFNRIAKRRNGVGLAVCENGVCTACNVRVRHSVVAELRKHNRIIQCDSCKRILFFEDESGQ